MAQSATRFMPCAECHRVEPDFELWERRGRVYCQRCLLNTAEKRAYENWHVTPNDK